MLLKEFIEFIRPAQRVIIDKGSVQCRYQMNNDRSNKFFNFIIKNGMYENMSNKEIEDILLESEIEEICSSLWFETGRSADSAISIKLKYISVKSLIYSLMEKEVDNKEEDLTFSIYNKYKFVENAVSNSNLIDAEVMFYNKDDSGRYNIFIDYDLEENKNDNNNGTINPSLPPNLSGANPHLKVAANTFAHSCETSTTGDE